MKKVATKILFSKKQPVTQNASGTITKARHFQPPRLRPSVHLSTRRLLQFLSVFHPPSPPRRGVVIGFSSASEQNRTCLDKRFRPALYGRSVYLLSVVCPDFPRRSCASIECPHSTNVVLSLFLFAQLSVHPSDSTISTAFSLPGCSLRRQREKLPSRTFSSCSARVAYRQCLILPFLGAGLSLFPSQYADRNDSKSDERRWLNCKARRGSFYGRAGETAN